MSVAVLSEDVEGCRSDMMSTDRPVLTFSRLVGETAQKLDSMFGVQDCLLEVNPGRVLLPPDFKHIAHSILDLQVRRDDIWLVSYPRTGSTWAQEMVWCIANNLDYERARSTIQQLRCPLLEISAVLSHEQGEWTKQLGNSVELVKDMASPRFIKSHLPWELLPRQLSQVKPKLVYVARNPKDMCVSFYHYCRLVHDMEGPFEDFCELFLKDKVPCGPIWNHIWGFWRRRHEPNIMFLTYEEMKRDLKTSIRRTASFLGKELTDEEVAGLSEYLSFGNMRKNPAVNLEPLLAQKHGPEFLKTTELHFIRKGEIGDWKNHMSSDMASRFDVWTEENLKGTSLKF